MPSFVTPLHEFNTCHWPAGSPRGGQFCSEKVPGVWVNNPRLVSAHLQRRAYGGQRAARLQRRLEHEMTHVGGNVQRATTLRRRMDVTGPLAVHGPRTTFWGTFRRHGPWRRKKR